MASFGRFEAVIRSQVQLLALSILYLLLCFKLMPPQTDSDLKFQFQLRIFNKEAHFLKLRESFGFSGPIKALFDEPAAMVKVQTIFFVA